jgi:hypothetical protein
VCRSSKQRDALMKARGTDCTKSCEPLYRWVTAEGIGSLHPEEIDVAYFNETCAVKLKSPTFDRAIAAYGAALCVLLAINVRARRGGARGYVLVVLLAGTYAFLAHELVGVPAHISRDDPTVVCTSRSMGVTIPRSFCQSMGGGECIAQEDCKDGATGCNQCLAGMCVPGDGQTRTTVKQKVHVVPVRSVSLLYLPAAALLVALAMATTKRASVRAGLLLLIATLCSLPPYLAYRQEVERREYKGVCKKKEP